MKNLFVKLFSVLAVISATNVFAIADRTVEIETLSGYRMPVNSLKIEAAYKALLAEELGGVEAQFQAFQVIFLFAKDYAGLNLTNAEAQAFADKYCKTVQGDGIKTLKEAVLYAKDYSGLNLTVAQAKNFTEKLLALPGPAERLKLHKKIYAFAKDYSGLNLTNAQALRHANDKVGIPND